MIRFYFPVKITRFKKSSTKLIRSLEKYNLKATFAMTTKGNKVLKIGKHVFAFLRKDSDSMTLWRCNRSTSTGCKALAESRQINGRIRVRMLTEIHSHD